MTDIRFLPSPTIAAWEWQLHGACRDMDSALFFHPERERGPSRQRRETVAKTICSRCPVIDSCRQHALAVREAYGIWGGLTESERDLMIRAVPRGRAS